MKKQLISLLSLVLLFSLMGCTDDGQYPSNQVCFYYSRAEYAYGTAEAVLVPEPRDITGHESDLDYLLALYLVGPLDEELVSPFPSQVRLVSIQQTEDQLTVELTDSGKAMNDAQFTLACGCLSKTCFELTDVKTVTICSGEQSITMEVDDLLLFDDVIP